MHHDPSPPHCVCACTLSLFSPAVWWLHCVVMRAMSTSLTRDARASLAPQSTPSSTTRRPPPPLHRGRRATPRAPRAKPERYYGENEQIIDRSPAMYDKLTDVFDKREEKDWIGLLAFSGKWRELRDGLFERVI